MRTRTFKNDPEGTESPIKSLSANYGMTHLINLLGEDITYVETGVCKGVSISFIVNRCPNIKNAYGIDSYQPHTDLFEKNGGATFDRFAVRKSYHRAKDRILSSGAKDKVTLILEDVYDVVDAFEDGSIDFLFLDHYLNASDVYKSCETWYNKVRNGGCFAGHDWVYDGVSESVNGFRRDYDITSPLSVFGAEWVWIKQKDI